MYDFYIILGCFGLRQDDFVNCNGIENVILKINGTLFRYNEMMDYFDSCRLFDKPLLEFNAVRHFVHNMYDRFDQVAKPLWMPQKFELYQKFIMNHRHCGLYIKLSIPNIEVPSMDQETDSIKISASSPNKLKLIRGGG